jgi:uncharacterized membrane protein YcaP (DUF421 family)
MWTITLPAWEFIARTLLIYLFVMVTLRFTGKRQIGQLAPFDLVLLLLLSNGVQNAMNGGDNTVTGGLIITTTLIAANSLVAWLTYRSKKIEQIIEGRPEILIHNGFLYSEIMKKNKLTHHELNTALRCGGCVSIDEVRLAVLENTGEISVIKK